MKPCCQSNIRPNTIPYISKSTLLNTGISKLGTTSIPTSTNPYIHSLSWGGTKWDWSSSSPSHHKLTYYFGSPTDSPYPQGVAILNEGNPVNLTHWTQAEKDAMTNGLQLWTDLIGMPIQEVYSFQEANLKFYITSDNIGYYGAQFGPHNQPYQGQGIYVRYPGKSWTTSLLPGGFGFVTIIHELGHALGLAHPHDSGGGSTLFSGVTDPHTDKGDNDLNQNTFTIMSYIDITSGINPSTPQDYGFCKGPMAFDIATIEYLYGLNTNYQSSPNTYTLTGETVKGQDGYQCIYDISGQDIIVYQGNQAVTIDLRPATIQNQSGGGGFISKINDSNIFSGFTIAQHTEIEQAQTGNGNDTIYTYDSVSNIIDGGLGIDSVHYQNKFQDYTIETSNNIVTVYLTSNPTIQDKLYNIEFLVFQDGTFQTSNIQPIIQPIIQPVIQPIIQPQYQYDQLSVSSQPQTITLNKTFINPIIILSTNNTQLPIVPRIKSIQSNSFQVDLQTPNNTYIPNTNLSYWVGESGTWDLGNDRFILWGKSLVSKNWITIQFPHTFSSIPIVLTQLQDGDNTNWTIVRTRNIQKISFQAILQNQESLSPSFIQSQNIGWVALLPGKTTTNDFTLQSQSVARVNHTYTTKNHTSSFSQSPLLFSRMSSYTGSDPAITQTRNINNSYFQIRIQEEQSRDLETRHYRETIDYIALEPPQPQPTPQPTPQSHFKYQKGKIQVNHQFQSIEFQEGFNDPIVLISDSTYKGSDPVSGLMKDLNPNGFQVRVKEPAYKNDIHVLETLCYWVVEKGSFDLDDASILQVGQASIGKDWQTIAFPNSFDSIPIVLTQIQSGNTSQWLVVRTQNLSPTSFQVKIQLEEKLKNLSIPNQILGWVAILPGTHSIEGLTILANNQSNVTHNWKTVYNPQFNTQSSLLFTKLISYKGADPTNTRIQNLSSTTFQIKLQEEQSRDKETQHIPETIGYIILN